MCIFGGCSKEIQFEEVLRFQVNDGDHDDLLGQKEA